ncbi:LysR substrate-binding domain-containing protein [Terrabacter sp. MAHUQ-38]|uniref:LysR substrate-binding domain-containing protein n=1 Tax=unclassified Terrabacter TaxID=2630222 RepID=UPI00165D7E73|nr:LysR substrate-binding domain-containing protein [Terrabacter sp. MAHUQ-38]MBC9823413.1 LysR family transcriptional regulator [Terrabacter sp. MAHUQ-38]
MTDAFRIEFVPGVTPDKWLRVWARRMPDSPVDAGPVDDGDALKHLREGTASMALLRLPVDKDGLHVIPLYDEMPVVVVAKEHAAAAFDEVGVADLSDEVLLQDPAEVPEWARVATSEARERSTSMPPMTTKQAISVVASGSGIVIVPLSVARLHHRKDVVHRPVTGVAPSHIGLAWRVDDDDPRLEAFIGIVRGRTERSSRGSSSDTPSGSASPGSQASPRAGSGGGPGRTARNAARSRTQRAGGKGGKGSSSSSRGRRHGRR